MYTSIEIPEIEDYPKGFPNFWINLIFVGSVSKSFKVNALAYSYVRLVEAALVEYRLGTSKLNEFWSTHDSFDMVAMHRSIAHFESCLSNMHRAINFYKRLRRNKEQDQLSLMLTSNRTTFATEAVAKKIRDVRNEIHHLDEHLINDNWQEGQWIALRPDGPERPHLTEKNQTIKSFDRLVIANDEILFSDLANWLNELAHVANNIANFQSAPKS